MHKNRHPVLIIKIFFCLLFFFRAGITLAQSAISLAGNWKVALDQTDEGILKRWYEGNLQDTIHLPGTTDLAHLGQPEQSPWINYLTRPYKYIGAAWYQKEINIPTGWQGYNVELYLERVLWESRVWLDGKAVGAPDDGLTVPHILLLGKLSPGKHTLTIRVDNRMIHPIGDKGHNYTELTQSIWNGIVGKIELIKRATAYTSQIKCFSDAAKKQVKVVTEIANSGDKRDAKLHILIRNSSHKIVGEAEQPVVLNAGKNNFIQEVNVAEAALWSEFQQPLYTAQVIVENKVQADTSAKITFGFRTVATKGARITINGIPAFIRGNQDCLAYPLTGHPPMNVDEWKKIFQLCKDYGFNQVRFHSACPPDAAFQAADELGIYVEAELVWMTSRNAVANIRPTSVTTGLPKGLGNGDRTIDSFVVKETHRILEQYGNHPSFCFFTFGNEMDNLNKKVVDGWVAALEQEDPRRLYAATTARSVLPHDEFQDSHFVPGTPGFIVNNSGKTNTRWSYDSIYVKSKVPVIAHELGQVPVYPDWKELKEYTGPLKPANLMKCEQLAVAHHVYDMDSAFHAASGYLQKILYKEDIESELRSAHSAGFNMLSMQDYPGQGEALVGWYNALWQSKGTIKPEEFRRWNDTLVPLASFDKYIWQGDETFAATLQTAFNGSTTIKSAIRWELLSGKNKTVFKSGKLSAKVLLPGSLVNYGNVAAHLPDVQNPQTFVLRVVSGNGHLNEWKFWLFPKQIKMPATPGNVVIADRINDALQALKEGKRVLLIADELGDASGKNDASFEPVFWSTAFFPGQGSQTLGAVIYSQHPALKYFPTDNVLDRQWQDLCSHGRAIVLDSAAADIDPIVAPVNDFHTSLKLASLFEAKVGDGSLLVCGYDIENNLDKRPAAKQLRKSLLAYISSGAFHPQKTVSVRWLQSKFYDAPTLNNEQVKGFEKALFYLDCGGSSNAGGDSVLANQDNIAYTLSKGKIYNANAAHGWLVNKDTSLQLSLHVPHTTLGGLYLHITSLDTKAKKITLTLEGRKTEFTVGKQQWVRIPFFREDFDDSQLLLSVQSNGQCLIKNLALMPE